MIVYCQVDLLIPMAHSLKDKRRVIKSLQDKLTNKYNVAVSEIDNNDIWKNSTLGIVSISKDNVFLEKLMESIIDYIEQFNNIQLLNYTLEYY